MPEPATPPTPPTITTSRLILRGHRVEDFQALAALWGDRAVTRHIGGKPARRQDAWMRLLRYGGLWPLLGFGYWAVVEKDSDTYIGDVGFADFKRDLIPPLDGVPEAGWVIATKAQGKGYATEAIRAALTWADRDLASAHTACIVSPGNLASLKTAAKTGFTPATQTLYGEDPVILLTRPRPVAASPGRSATGSGHRLSTLPLGQK